MGVTALLARKCWRIIDNPDSLLVRVLKGKYFPYGSLMQTEEGERPSWG
uniref:Uncharacterized protein n=1 Tax=Manihot esculenta TaxID=3983 RepID=A0A2C9U2U2_MANES